MASRAKNSKYSYSDLFITHLYTVFCGGRAIENVNYLKDHTLKGIKSFKVPSPDTILRGNAELATNCDYI
ncbi:MAG: hypothetical protein ACK5H1_06625 [Tenacibaculum sp.]